MEHEIMGQKIPVGLPHYQSSLCTPSMFALEPVYPIIVEESKESTKKGVFIFLIVGLNGTVALGVFIGV